MVAISLAHVSKRYKDAEAVRDLSLDIADGECMVILGPSGCGKTTALRLIAGLERPDAGEIRFDGEVVNDVPADERDVAMVFEDYALYPNMRVQDNLAFPLRMRKTPADAIRDRIGRITESSELEPVLERKPGALASGEAQQVAVGRAVIRETTAVFLLDDAMAHLDAHQRLGARAELARLHRQLGATIVTVTHDQAEAMAVGTRVAVMDDGQLRQVAPPRWLYEQPADTFVAGFIGDPPMNLFEMRVEPDADGVRLHHADWSWQLPAVGPLARIEDAARLVVGCRPEHLRVATVPGPAEIGFEAICDLVQYLGGRHLVHLHAGDITLAALVESLGALAAGERVTCAVPLARLHLFDQATGRALDVA